MQRYFKMVIQSRKCHTSEVYELNWMLGGQTLTLRLVGCITNTLYSSSESTVYTLSEIPQTFQEK